MDTFLVLCTVAERELASALSEALENEGMSVMLEHVQIRSGFEQASGYRILVLSKDVEQATLLVAQVKESYLSSASRVAA